MIIVMRHDATEEDLEHVVERVESCGLRAHVSRGTTRTIVGCIGDETALVDVGLRAIRGVEDVIPVQRPYKLAARAMFDGGSLVPMADVVFGGSDVVVVAGPCSVESRSSLLEIARHVKASGARALRGGAFKPRTSPYSFRGMGKEGLELLAEARKVTGLPVVSEAMSPQQVALMADKVDMVQVGARNMQNFELLEELGRSDLPVLLKRGSAATLTELLLAAEYVLNAGNMKVVLCERGMRTFERATRNTLDISAVPVLKRETHLPVIVDPSHAAGRRDIVIDLAGAAVAAGADGILVEVHSEPERALSDGDQSLDFPQFDALMERVRVFAKAIGRDAQAPLGVAAGARDSD